MKYFLVFFALAFITSCGSDTENAATYFGGKIINPKSDFVLLYHQDKVIDSLTLDKDNRFLGSYNNLLPGLYYFEHGPEHQYIYIEPQDSILIRLNTWDFDESLVFSGKGADKNNILIDCFIESEEEDNNYTLYSYYKLNPKAFKEKFDSVLALKQLKIDAFKSKNLELSDRYMLLLDIAAKYPIYNRFERYPEANRKKTHKKVHTTVDSTFYSYRKQIDTNDDSLMFFGSYSRYVVERLYNDVYMQGYTTEANDFIIALLNSVDKSIHTEKLKNTLLRRMLINDFYRISSCDIDKKAFHTFFKLSSDIEDKKHVQRLLNDVKHIFKGSTITDFDVTDYNKSTHSIHKLIKHKNSVIYFWNPKYISNSYLASRINYLSKRYPKINFIGIKFATSNIHPVKGIDIKNQFYIEATSKANLFLTSKLPRTVLVTKRGVLTNGYTSINNRTIHKQIESLQKN
ncbi:MAG: hypothetical protein JKZ00_06275 [Flavobacteriaceae bacterium]|nr:hypothetical protein [Flavobacteriaceae bacterium]